MKTKIRIGGVPEHFNLPWHLAIENKHFAKENIEVEWQEFKGGTGAMCKGLRGETVDVCIVLTEGIVADIVKGNASKLVSMYLNTPLIWGVYTGSKNPINYYGEIYNKQYAISRKGSGSHLIPLIDAFAKDQKIDDSQFSIVKNLDGALESLDKLETDVFFWEKYTTQPYVDSGQLKFLGECVPPWSSFAIVATDKAIKTMSPELRKVLDIIYFVVNQFMNATTTIEMVSNRYHQKLTNVEQWFYSTEWCTNDSISKKMLDNVVHQLFQAKIIDRKVAAGDLCFRLPK